MAVCLQLPAPDKFCPHGQHCACSQHGSPEISAPKSPLYVFHVISFHCPLISKVAVDHCPVHGINCKPAVIRPVCHIPDLSCLCLPYHHPAAKKIPDRNKGPHVTVIFLFDSHITQPDLFDLKFRMTVSFRQECIFCSHHFLENFFYF